MTGLDTNVIVRVLTADDPTQTAVATAALRQPAWLAKSVILETAWVLGFTYDFTPDQIAAALRKLTQLQLLEIEDRAQVGLALTWFEQGFDFADALHLASAGPSLQFATFDRSFAKRANALGGGPPMVLLNPPG